MWQNMAGLGGNNESLKMPEILLIAPATDVSTVNPKNGAKTETKPEFNATGGIVVDAVALPGTAQDAKKPAGPSGGGNAPAAITVDLKSQAHDLAKQPGMAWLDDLTTRTDVDWKTVQLVHDNWDYKHAGLTPEGGIVVAIVVTILTWGAGSSLAATATTVAETGVTTATTVGGLAVSTTTAAGVTTYTTLGAVLNAGFTALATQTATSLINNQGDVGKTLKDLGSDENVKQLVISMATAGALEAIGGTSWASSVSKTTGLSERLITNLTSAAVSSTISTAIEGGDYTKNLESALLTAGINTAVGWAAGEIGDWYANSDLAGKYIAHKVSHAVLGCAGAAAKGGDCLSGAIGAAVGEAFAEMYSGTSDGSVLSTQKQQEVLNLSKLVAMATAKAAGNDPIAAMDAAQLAVTNNWGSTKKKAIDPIDAAQGSSPPPSPAEGFSLVPLPGYVPVITPEGVIIYIPSPIPVPLGGIPPSLPSLPLTAGDLVIEGVIGLVTKISDLITISSSSQPDGSTSGVNSPPLFRGGNNLDARLGVDVKPASDGLIHPISTNGKPQGLSLNLDPNDKFIQQYGGAFPVKSVPNGLLVIQSGKSGHYVIAPSTPMTFEKYQQLLNQVQLRNFNVLP